MRSELQLLARRGPDRAPMTWWFPIWGVSQEGDMVVILAGPTKHRPETTTNETECGASDGIGYSEKGREWFD
jgi:hypothetical protein